jgi:hypothetical protein
LRIEILQVAAETRGPLSPASEPAAKPLFEHTHVSDDSAGSREPGAGAPPQRQSGGTGTQTKPLR